MPAKKTPAPPDVSPLCRRNTYQFLQPDGEIAAELQSEVRLGSRWLTTLWVKADLRRKGLARQLLQAAIGDYWDEVLYLHVLAFDGRSMPDAALLAFYSSFGFAETEVPGILKRIPANGLRH